MDPLTTLHTTRVLPFTPDAVYAAFASPERLAQWWGPEGFTNAFETFDFTEGGRWVFDMIGPEGTRYRNENVFEALAPGERVVIRHVCAPLFTLTVSLAAAPGGTHLSWTQAFDDAATAQAIRHICEPANEQNLDRLTRVLAQPGASGSR